MENIFMRDLEIEKYRNIVVLAVIYRIDIRNS
jgi:hypothetical protein